MKQEKNRSRRKKGPGRMPYSRTPKPCNPWNWFIKKEKRHE
jgi:hypothetical protein